MRDQNLGSKGSVLELLCSIINKRGGGGVHFMPLIAHHHARWVLVLVLDQRGPGGGRAGLSVKPRPPMFWCWLCMGICLVVCVCVCVRACRRAEEVRLQHVFMWDQWMGRSYWPSRPLLTKSTPCSPYPVTGHWQSRQLFLVPWHSVYVCVCVCVFHIKVCVHECSEDCWSV